jgi:hypothetical protein
MRLYDTPQDHTTWQYTLGVGFWHAGTSTQAPRCKFACHLTAALINCCQAINLFISSADQLYGPITTLRRDGRVFKKIPWTAFTLSDSDWARVLDAKAILAVSIRF